MWQLIKDLLIENDKATALSRGLTILFAAIGIVCVPILLLVGSNAVAEFRSMRDDIKTVAETMQKMDTAVQLGAARGLYRDRRLDLLEAEDKGHSTFLTDLNNRTAQLEYWRQSLSSRSMR